jgi:hypothetical protein
VSWYLRSLNEGDTHHVSVEVLSAGVVTADCGVEFRPLVLPSGGLALSAGPADPRQVCPVCLAVPG